MLIKLLMVALSFVCVAATAKAEQVPPEIAIAESPLVPDSHPEAFRPNRWTEGLHLLTGIGVNGSVFNSETAHISAGLGTNFKADIGWYFNDRCCGRSRIGGEVQPVRKKSFVGYAFHGRCQIPIQIYFV